MIGKPGPFQIIEHDSLDFPSEPPRRRHSCNNYENCLNLAAALNWDSFTCRGCDGSINTALCWRAQQELKKDKVTRSICSAIPDINCLERSLVPENDPDDSPDSRELRVIGKR